MPFVSHDATPDRAFRCDGFESPWNGWAVPVWASAHGLASALGCVLGDGATVAVSGDAVAVSRPGEPDETFTRDACGMWAASGWCWVPAHRRDWDPARGDTWCRDCGSVTDYCTQDRF